jgi:manganese-dependent ADP-ribose/CDP-alcohol diphosphatase
MRLLIASFFALLISTYMQSPGNSYGQMPADQGRKALFSFGIIADVQYCGCEPVGTRYYRLSTTKLREAMNTFRSDSVKFVVNLGDLIDHDYESYKPVMNILDSSGLKVYHLTGNHDYSVDPRYKKRLPLPQPAKEGYYSFVVDHFRFIALNGNELSTYASANKSQIKQAEDYITLLKDSGSINAIDWNGGVSTKQLEWLKDQLDDANVKNEKVFILCHFPIFPEGIHNLLNYKEVLSLLGNYHNIIASFSGHNHSGNYGNFNLIHFVTIKGMVETENTNSYARVDVYGNKIWITGSGREKSLILAY